MRWFRPTPNERRERALKSVPAGALRDYLSVPFPDPRTPLDELQLLALDFETTGLDPGRDHVLSVGFVPVDGRSIVLGGARQLLVRADVEVGQSATVHGLTDDILEGGVPLDEAVDVVLEALQGRVLLAHFARIEETFLRAACERRWGSRMPCARIDTLALQQRLITSAWGSDVPEGSLRLWAARARYGLPVYRAHEALMDAISGAELYLAQTCELGVGKSGLTLGSVAG